MIRTCSNCLHVAAMTLLVMCGISSGVTAAEDLTGYWQPLITEDYEMRMLGTRPGDYGGIALNEGAKSRAEKFRPGTGSETLLLDKCGPHGAARIMFTNTRLHITRDQSTITMELEAEGQKRRFYLDERKRKGGDLHWQGHSIAYHQGKSMLTVVTRHMRPALLRSNGIPYSEEAILTEHYVRHGEYFTVIQTLEDPKYLTGPFITSTSFHKIPEPADWQMGSCQP